MRGIKTFAVAVAIALSTSVASAQLVNETFTYGDGSLVGNGGWTTHSGTAGQMQVASGSVNVVMTQTEDVNMPIGATLGAGGTFYAALDVTVSHTAPMPEVVEGASPPSVEYFAHFKNDTLPSGTQFRSRIFTTGISGSDYTYGIRATSGTNPNATWATGFTYGTTQRVVVSFEFDSGLAKMWVNPANELSTSISATGGAAQAIAAFALRSSSGGTQDPTHNVDNLCIDNTFDGALLCPEPGSALLIGLGAMVLFRRRR
jgi:hypothetical protein